MCLLYDPQYLPGGHVPAAPSARAKPRHADERVLPVAARLPPVRVRVRVRVGAGLGLGLG